MAKKHEAVAETFRRIYSLEGVDECQRIIANVKEIFGRIGVKCQITSRIKGPISILNKYNSNTKYAEDWNSIKDLIGLMIVVDSNQDIDKILYYVNEEFADLQNPNSELLYRDYRKENYRSKNGMKDDSAGLFDPPSPKGYQIHNGYKNVRINLMDLGYPIEIQLKTKEQYIAHEATHDPVYKSPRLKTKEDETMIAGALFPYFEACAHLELHKHEMSDKQIARCREDIMSIFKRNEPLFNQFSEVFNDACQIYAVYMFILKNQKNIYAEQTLNGSVLNMKLLESEILRIFHYKEKELSRQDPSLSKNDRFVRTITTISNMTYSDFATLRDQIAGNHRMENCAIIGLFDLISKEEIDLIHNFSESFRNVQVAIYDDELAELIYGQPPMFTFEERKKTVEALKGVSNIIKVGVSGQVEFTKSIAPMMIEDAVPKKYKIGYLPGVFDMLHPGHREYIEKVCAVCEKVIIGAKSDEYVINRKGKTPVLSEELRLPVLKSIRGVEDVVLTDYDIALPKEVREIMLAEARRGGKCAIFAGSDWFLKPEKKGLESSEELQALVGASSFSELHIPDLLEQYQAGNLEVPTIHPNVFVTCIPRDDGKKPKEKKEEKSSTSYRQKGIYSRDNIVKKNEVITMGE